MEKIEKKIFSTKFFAIFGFRHNFLEIKILLFGIKRKNFALEVG